MSAAGACLVAGCGDVGQRLAVRLRAAGRRVYGLRRSAAALPAGVQTLQADLTDADSLRVLPDDIADVVFLPAPGQRDEGAYRGLYLDGLRHLVQALRARAPLRRVLFASSSAVYGEHGGDWVDEDTPCAPLAFNGAVLRQAEQWLAAQPEQGIVVRLSGLYGPGRTRLVDQVAAGTARVPPGARHWTNRIHVDDAAAALQHLLDLPQPAACYVASDDAPAGLDEVYAFLAQRLGLPVPPSGAAPHLRAVGNKRLRNARLRDSGFAFAFPDFRAGYAALIAPARGAV